MQSKDSMGATPNWCCTWKVPMVNWASMTWARCTAVPTARLKLKYCLVGLHVTRRGSLRCNSSKYSLLRKELLARVSTYAWVLSSLDPAGPM
eukprot:scaffold460_cov391-Pavlova_lutheri.AAC.4